MIEEESIQEYIIFVNIYASNIGPPKYIRQIIINIKGEINSITIRVGNFDAQHASIDRKSRQKLIKKQWT